MHVGGGGNIESKLRAIITQVSSHNSSNAQVLSGEGIIASLPQNGRHANQRPSKPRTAQPLSGTAKRTWEDENGSKYGTPRPRVFILHAAHYSSKQRHAQFQQHAQQSRSLSPSKFLNREFFLSAQRARDLGKKTLILDLDETLVHSSFNPVANADIVLPVEIENKRCQVYVLKRPGVDEFLYRMTRYYEVVIFTASLPKYADPLIDLLDKHKYRFLKLFREHCTVGDNSFIKDLSRVGRESANMIIIDNSPNSYRLQPQNALPITSWYDNKDDRELLALTPILEKLSRVSDVRTYLRQIVKNNQVQFSKASQVLRSPSSTAQDAQQKHMQVRSRETRELGRHANSRDDEANVRSNLSNLQGKKRFASLEPSASPLINGWVQEERTPREAGPNGRERSRLRTIQEEQISGSSGRRARGSVNASLSSTGTQQAASPVRVSSSKNGRREGIESSSSAKRKERGSRSSAQDDLAATSRFGEPKEEPAPAREELQMKRIATETSIQQSAREKRAELMFPGARAEPARSRGDDRSRQTSHRDDSRKRNKRVRDCLLMLLVGEECASRWWGQQGKRERAHQLKDEEHFKQLASLHGPAKVLRSHQQGAEHENEHPSEQLQQARGDSASSRPEGDA